MKNPFRRKTVDEKLEAKRKRKPRAYMLGGAVMLGAFVQQVGGCADVPTQKNCGNIQVFDNHSTGICWNLGGSNMRIGALCKGPSHTSNGTFYFSGWVNINGIHTYLYEGGANPALCNYPNYVENRFYDFA